MSLEGEEQADTGTIDESTKVSPKNKAKKSKSTPPLAEIKQQQAVGSLNSLPDLSDLKAQKVDNPQPAPGLENQESSIKLSETKKDEEKIAFGDDYTPVTIISNTILEEEKRNKLEISRRNEKERMSANAKESIYLPRENLITIDDLNKSRDLNQASDLKQVISHLFNHLRRDFKNLMWVEKDNNSLFSPKYVYGDWKMTEPSWRRNINISKPNIFRIPYNSSLPFHGEISDNPYNDKYFEWWTAGRKPDFATIFPAIFDSRLHGFIVCFDKNSEFDNIGSLRKVENLLSICKKSFLKLEPQRAA